MAFLYVDALGLDHRRLQAMSGIGDRDIAFDVPVEPEVITLLQRLPDAGSQLRVLWADLLDLLQIHHEKQGDERIRRSMVRLTRDPSAAGSLAGLAAEVNLSESRYLHLFKQTTGVPLRRFGIDYGTLPDATTQLVAKPGTDRSAERCSQLPGA